MYSLYSQHLQSLNSVQQNLFVLQTLKDMFQMRSPALHADLDSFGKVPFDPPPLSDGSDGCCDGCLEFRDGLGVVLLHPVLEVTPQIEVWGGGVRSGECGNQGKSKSACNAGGVSGNI